MLYLATHRRHQSGARECGNKGRGRGHTPQKYHQMDIGSKHHEEVSSGHRAQAESVSTGCRVHYCSSLPEFYSLDRCLRRGHAFRYQNKEPKGTEHNTERLIERQRAPDTALHSTLQVPHQMVSRASPVLDHVLNPDHDALAHSAVFSGSEGNLYCVHCAADRQVHKQCIICHSCFV